MSQEKEEELEEASLRSDVNIRTQEAQNPSHARYIMSLPPQSRTQISLCDVRILLYIQLLELLRFLENSYLNG